MTPFTTLMIFLSIANASAGVAMIYLWGHPLMGIALVVNSFVAVGLAHWAWGDKDVW